MKLVDQSAAGGRPVCTSKTWNKHDPLDWSTSENNWSTSLDAELIKSSFGRPVRQIGRPVCQSVQPKNQNWSTSESHWSTSPDSKLGRPYRIGRPVTLIGRPDVLHNSNEGWTSIGGIRGWDLCQLLVTLPILGLSRILPSYGLISPGELLARENS